MTNHQFGGAGNDPRPDPSEHLSFVGPDLVLFDHSSVIGAVSTRTTILGDGTTLREKPRLPPRAQPVHTVRKVDIHIRRSEPDGPSVDIVFWEPRKRNAASIRVRKDNISFYTVERQGSVVFDSRTDVPVDMQQWETTRRRFEDEWIEHWHQFGDWSEADVQEFQAEREAANG